jgi:hypothetical protein
VQKKRHKIKFFLCGLSQRVQHKNLGLGADALDFPVRGERFSLLEEGRGEVDLFPCPEMNHKA